MRFLPPNPGFNHRFLIRKLMAPVICLAFLFLSLVSHVSASSGWETGEPSLGGMNLNGAPALQVPLGNLSGSPELAFSLTMTLKSMAEVQANVATSRQLWTVPQLTTNLVPANRDFLLWTQPGGDEVAFKTALISKDWNAAGATDWAIREASPQAYEIRHCRNGLVYRYFRGQIAELAAASGRALKFDCRAGRIVSITQAEAGTTPLLTAAYDGKGRLTKLEIGPLSHAFTWADDGSLTAWQRAGLPQATRFAYAQPEAGHSALSAVTSPDGGKLEYDWVKNPLFNAKALAAKDDLVTRPYVLGGERTSKIAYAWKKTPDSFELTVTDAAQRTSALRFNTRNGEVVSRLPDGSEWRSVYHARSGGDSRLVSQKGPDGKSTLELSYDLRGNVISRVSPGSPKIDYAYDDQNRLLEVRRAGQVMSKFAYEGASRQPAAISDALGNTLALRYDARGQTVWLRDLRGAEHRFAYDALGHQTGHQLPLGYLTSAVYDRYGRVTEATEADGSQMKRSFNTLGQIATAEERTSTGAVTQWACAYGPLGELSAMKRNGQPWLSIVKDKRPDGTATVTQTDALGAKTVSELDANGALSRVTNALGETTSYERDATGELLAWTDAAKHRTQFQHDAMGRVSNVTDALGRKQSWLFDKLGQLKARENGVQKISYRYDEAGRVTSEDYGQGQTVNYQRDVLGRLIKSATGDVATEYLYDALDRAVAFKQTLPDGTVQGIAQTFTPAGDRESLTLLRSDAAKVLPISLKLDAGKTGLDLPALQTEKRSYDLLGRVTKVTVNGEEKLSYVYDAKTLRLSERTTGNKGLKTNYSYDAEGRLARVSVSNAEGIALRGAAYQWDDYGRLAQRTLLGFKAKDGKPAPDNRIVQTFSYDALGRVTAMKCPAAPELEESYAYDATGNITERKVSGKKVVMTYDSANQLLERIEIETQGKSKPEKTTYAYDAAGRMKEEACNGAKKGYTWGYLDKILNINSGSSKTNYHYAANGQLVSKSDVTSSEPWLWDGLALAARGGQRCVNESHACGGSLTLTLEKDAEELVLNDYLGTSLASISNKKDGTKAQDLLAGLLGGNNTNRSIRFTGKPADSGLGNVFLHRNFKSEVGRWSNADPSGFPDGSNSQKYCPNTLSEIDSMGLASARVTFTPDGEPSPYQTAWAFDSYRRIGVWIFEVQTRVVSDGWSATSGPSIIGEEGKELGISTSFSTETSEAREIQRGGGAQGIIYSLNVSYTKVTGTATAVSIGAQYKRYATEDVTWGAALTYAHGHFETRHQRVVEDTATGGWKPLPEGNPYAGWSEAASDATSLPNIAMGIRWYKGVE